MTAATSGCQPVVETREFRYSALVSIEGREHMLAGTYTCYHDNPFLDMGGRYWYAVRHEPLAGGLLDLALRGVTPNGVVFEIHPTLEAVLQLSGRNLVTLREGICAIGLQDELASVFFYRRPGDAVYHSSTAAHGASELSSDMILKSAKHELIGRGHALHAEHYRTSDGENRPTATFYSVIPYTMDGKTIDELGMRAYLESHPAIWLKAGATLPLDRERARELQGLGFPFSEQVRRFRFSLDWRAAQPMAFSSDSRWQPGSVRDWVRMDAAQAARISAGSSLLDWTPPPPTVWVDYKGCRIEIPLLQFERRHVYDPGSDQLVVFEPEFAVLSDQ